MLDAFNAKGRTALMLAANSGNEPMVQALLENGADPTVLCCGDDPGRTARDFAFAANKRSQIMGMLQAAEAAWPRP